MKKKLWFKVTAFAILALGTGTIYLSASAMRGQQQLSEKRASEKRVPEKQPPSTKVELPQHQPVPGDGKNMVVQLCDGETNLTLEGVSPDQRLTPQQAQSASDQLMAKWLAKNDPARSAAWLKELTEANKASQTPARQQPRPATTGQQKEQYVDFSSRDYAMWKRELDREVAYGDKIFHDDKLVGSTNGVSCAMCHPHASNTHPETYPKFQIQLRRVALLRDMINWCIENPSRGKILDADDPKMRALEAYIMAQRKGVAMEYGKH